MQITTGSRWYGHYSLFVDWDDNDNYTGTYDDITGRFISADILRGLAGPLSYSAVPARIEIEVDNGDRFFSSDNENSPIYENLSSLAKKRCKMICTANATDAQLFDGWLKEVASTPSSHGRKTATLVIDDLVGRLSSTPLTSLMFQNVSEVDLLGVALAEVSDNITGVTASYETALDEYDFAGDLWKESETAALDAIGDITRSCLGIFFTSRTGVPTYHNRQHRPLNYTLADWDASLISRIDAIGLQDSDIVNEVLMVFAQRRALTPASVVWTLSESVDVPPGGSATYTVSFTDPATGSACGVLDGITPVAGTDFSPTTAGLSMDVVWGGAEAKVTFGNTSGSQITVTSAQLRGTPIVRYDQAQVSDSSGILPRKSLWHGAPLVQKFLVAQSFVEYIFSLVSSLTDKPRQATITPDTAANLLAASQVDINDTISVLPGSVSFVNWVHHQIGPGYHTLTVGITPSEGIASMWQLGISQLGIDNNLGV